jgi:hypothetical protein
LAEDVALNHEQPAVVGRVIPINQSVVISLQRF